MPAAVSASRQSQGRNAAYRAISPEGVAQRKLQMATQGSRTIMQQRAVQQLADNSTQVRQHAGLMASAGVAQLKFSGDVIQARWIDNGDGTATWSGRKKPTARDLQELQAMGLTQVDYEYDEMTKFSNRTGRGGGFYKKGGENRMVTIDNVTTTQKGTAFDPQDAHDTTSYFGGSLQVHHQGPEIEQQYLGAPFPAPKKDNPVLKVQPQHQMGWLQEDLPSQETERRPEAQIMGWSANDAIESSGLMPQPFSPWAHTRPDHSHPPDREDPSIRHPSYVGANQQHSAFEGATSGFIKDYGAIGVGRNLTDPVGGGSGLYSQMEMSFMIPTGEGFLNLKDSVPYFTNTGARGGDSQAIQEYMELQYFKQLGREYGDMDEDSEEMSY